MGQQRCKWFYCDIFFEERLFKRQHDFYSARKKYTYGLANIYYKSHNNKVEPL